MLNALRTAVLCMLLAAVPLQGFAAGAMLYCGPDGDTSTTAVPSATVDAHHHAAADDGAGHHHADDGTPASGHLHDGGCSVCATCCSAAALPPSTAVAHAPAIQRHAPDALGIPTPAHPVEGPERPPRSRLA